MTIEIKLYSTEAKQLWNGREKTEGSALIPGLALASARHKKWLGRAEKSEIEKEAKLLDAKISALREQLKNELMASNRIIEEYAGNSISASKQESDCETKLLKFGLDEARKIALIIHSYDELMRSLELARTITFICDLPTQIRKGVEQEFKRKIRSLIFRLGQNPPR